MENRKCLNNIKIARKQQPSQPQPQPKKQVRKRLHTSKPYQDRLLNMAEARKEIVTALKFHRASMKQKSRKFHSVYPSTAATTTTTTTATTTANVTNSYSTPLSYNDNQYFILPSKTLGLNLNFKNFRNLDCNFYQKPMSMCSASSTSSVFRGEKTEVVSNSSGGLHYAMDDEEIRSLGEKHETEWNDTVNLVTSERWCNFLKTMEIEGDEGDEFKGFRRFDQDMEIPPWLVNINESSCLQENFDDHFSDEYFQDPALPCMEIGEIEAMDDEWLA